jgi:hypothetical protein
MRGAIPSLPRASSYCGSIYWNRKRKPFLVVSTETRNKGYKILKETKREKQRQREKE